MGTPAVSFFPGDILLSVDKKLIEMNRIFYSRDIHEIVDFVSKSKKSKTGVEESKRVQREVFKKLDGILEPE
jgi:predicted glycosyltransferase